MNLELTDEQQFLRDAARQALARHKTIEAARETLDTQIRSGSGTGGGERPDLWPSAVEAGWPGLLVSDERGGAGLGAFDAMLVLEEAGRGLADVGLLGHLPATQLLDAAGHEAAERAASGEVRAAFVPAQPPGDLDTEWTVESEEGMARRPAPVLSGDTLDGEVPWVVDAPAAGLYVVAAVRDGAPVAVLVEAGDGVEVREVHRYDPTRRVGHVRFSGAAASVLEGAGAEELERAWYLAQALLAAEALGAVETCLEMGVAYAKERFTFGRAIGSYQAVKHGLVEILRRQENTRSLLYYAGFAHASSPDEFALAASAARSAAGEALDFAARENISVHGGIGATWEHDAPLFFRRAQLTRRLLGGNGGATDRVAGELLRKADGTPDPDTAAAGAAAATSVEA